MNIKKILLIPLTILLGIFLGYQSHNSEKSRKNNITDGVVYVDEGFLGKSYEVHDLHTPKFVSELLVNHKSDYQANRPTPSTKEEKIVAYYEDVIAKQYDKNDEVYEQNGTLYLNLEGTPKVIASHGEGYESAMMMPKLSASKEYVVYQLCNDKYDGCSVVLESLETKTKKVLEDVVSYAWHPKRDLLLYDGAQKDDGHAMLESEIFIFDVAGNAKVYLTDTDEFVESYPIFSEDGNSIYCSDEKTGKLLYIDMFVTTRPSYIKALKMFKTADTLGIEEIKNHAKSFKSIAKNEKFAEPNMSYWIELTFSDEMESGLYRTFTMPYIFDEISFTPEQLTIKDREAFGIPVEKMRTYDLVFNYDAKKDAKRYYCRLKSYTIPSPFGHGFYRVEKMKQVVNQAEQYVSYNYSKKGLIETILSAMVVGMILMSALYTAVMFFRRRKDGKSEKAFIYYTLMQVSMAMFLLTAPVFFRGLFSFESISMGQLTLVTAFFATLFTQAFLNTKKHLPTIDTLLNVYLVLILADMIWIFEPILMNYKLYEFFGLLYLLTAILRIKSGFKPAWFYLFGWIGLLLTIFLMDYYHLSNFTMFIGVFIEAVLLAWGLVFYVEGEG
jgi:hypothetical protein